MLLITAAYKNEVKSLLSGKPFQKLESKVYRSGMIYIVISGEGSANVRECCRLIEKRYSMESIRLLNVGTAGSLAEKYAPGDLVEVGQVTAELPEEFSKSFTLENAGQNVKCVSALQRVEDKHYANRLAKYGDIVDRELWYWAEWAATRQIACQSLKIISDRAYAFPGTERVIEIMASLSERLADEVRKMPEWNL